jgi:hypothetical protein
MCLNENHIENQPIHNHRLSLGGIFEKQGKSSVNSMRFTESNGFFGDDYLIRKRKN